MPFTPFHFGHALPIAFLDFKKKRIDLFSCIVGSVIVDIHAAVLFIFHLGTDYHGVLHSFFSAILLGCSVGILLHLGRPAIRPLLRWLKWEQETSAWNKMFWASVMACAHVLLDATIYPEMEPWWPFHMRNPFFGAISSASAYLICIVGGICGVILYFIRIGLNNESEKKPANPSDDEYYLQFAS